jgi:SNF2 family DNA or RNA helicase
LTGTPVENDLGELWALFDFLMPGLLGSAEQFREQFRVAIEQGGDEERMQALRRRVAPFILRRKKEDVAPELPPKTELVYSVELSGDQRDLYESIRAAAHGEVRQAIRQRGFGASSIAILDALMKLRQVCCDPRLVAVSAAAQVKESAKLEACLELLMRQLESGRRVLLFSQFAKMLKLLAIALEERGIRYLMLTGATQHRQAVVDRFEAGQAEVFLISLKAGGTGLNLTSADTVIHYDPWWNPAVEEQATNRAHRIGQEKPVFVYRLVTRGSIEEKMELLKDRKRELARGIFDADAGSTLDLTERDIDDLFAAG